MVGVSIYSLVFFFKQKTAYEMRISDWSSDVCSSDLIGMRNAYFGTTIVGYIVEKLPFVRRVYRNCHSSELCKSEPGDNKFRAVRRHDHHAVLSFHARARQAMRNPVHGLVEIAVEIGKAHV